MSKLAIICASPRPSSASGKVAAYLQSLIDPAQHTIQTATFLGFQIRSVGEGKLQPNEVTAQQQQILDVIKSAEKVIWVVPEYNRGVPAEMIAFLEHFAESAYDYLWTDKVHAVVGVSSGIGGREPIYYLAKVLGYVITSYGKGNCYVSPHSFQSINTDTQFDAAGTFVGDARYAENAQKFLAKLL